MDANNPLKRDRPHNDDEKAEVSSTRPRNLIMQDILTQTRDDNEAAAAQYLMNQSRQNLMNSAFQMQQTTQQPGIFATNFPMNPERANQQRMLHLRQNANSLNPFAGLPGLQGLQQQLHSRTANNPHTSDLIASLQARLRYGVGGNGTAAPSGRENSGVGGLFRNHASARPAANVPSSQSINFQPQQQTSGMFQMPGAASMRSLSAASSQTNQDVGSSLQGNNLMDEKSMAILTSCPADLKLLYTPTDDWKLSPYQCLARRQIEIFEASDKDLEAGAQGRNRPIVLGQVGIRCRWCACQPSRQRQRASAYYPSQLNGIYQAAQNITNTHMSRLCQSVPPVIRDELVRLQAKKSGAGGGKKYWSQSAKDQDVYEVEDGGLRLASSSPSTAANKEAKTDGASSKAT